MKQKCKGFSKVWIVIVVLVVAFVALVAVAYNNKKAEDAALAEVDASKFIEGNESNGGLPDNIKGSKDAKVVLFEYADYQCPACAYTFPYLSDLIEEYDGEVALVFRTLIMSYHKYGTAAAAAANAAGLQGYWPEYAKILFAEQDTWENATVSDRDSLFDQYFETATGGEGDLEKFHTDMNSESVQQKISFDAAIAKKIGVNATPSVFLNGKQIDFNTVDETEFKEIFREAIEAAK